jgi:hypothetical protein
MQSKTGYRDLKHPIADAPLYMRRQRHGFTTVIRDTYLTHMPLLSARLNYLSASKHTLYDMTLVCTTEGTALFPVARESAWKDINPPHQFPSHPF